MLIRLVAAIKNTVFLKEIREKLNNSSDIQIKILPNSKKSWQAIVRSCADIFLIDETVIPNPIESQIAVLNNLPEKPLTVILHGNDSPEDHAQLVATGADTVLYSGISTASLIEALEAVE